MRQNFRPLLASALVVLNVSALASTPNAASTLTSSAISSTKWAQVNGVYLRYELSGAGKDTVVLLHELSTSLETWDYVMPALTRKHRVLRYDLRGFGLSQRVKDALTMDDEMSDLRSLLDNLGIHGKVTLIGGAVGGAIALKYAATYPDQVSGVVAISPAAYMQARMKPGETGSAVPAQSNGGSVDAAYPVKMQQQSPERFARFLAIQAAADQVGSMATTPAAYTISYSEVLPNIKCPALIVATSLWMRPPESFKELAAAIPHGQFKVLETGHFAAIESPELVAPVLVQFLDEIKSK